MQDKRYNFKHIFLIIKTAPCDRESVVYADTGPISLEFIIPAFIFAYRLKGNAGAISINLKCRKSSRRKTKVVSFFLLLLFSDLSHHRTCRSAYGGSSSLVHLDIVVH